MEKAAAIHLVRFSEIQVQKPLLSFGLQAKASLLPSDVALQGNGRTLGGNRTQTLAHHQFPHD